MTVIPVPGGEKSDVAVMGRSTAYFPVIGLVLGLVLAGLNWLFRMIFPGTLTAALLVAVMTVFTGGLHLDGLMDTCDGVFVRRTPEERLRIMDDTHAGAFGVIGAILIIMLKFAAVSGLPALNIWRPLIAAPVISRFFMTFAVFAFPYARPEGLGRIFKQETNAARFIIALVLTLAIVSIAAGIPGLAILAVTWAIITLAAVYFKRRLGGLTGDTYGAINEIAEVIVLIAFTALPSINLAVN